MSDHFFRPRAIAGPAGDITDVWAFPSPDRPGHLVSVLGVLPAAKPGARFSEAIVCRFRLRPVAISGTGAEASFRFGPEAEELVIDCGFSAPRPSGSNGILVQEGWCETPSGETVEFTVGDEQGASINGLRVYAGPRADPFYFDVPAWLESMQAGQLAFKERGTNVLDGLNILGVVVEIDTRPWVETGRRPLFGVVGETIAAGPLPIRIERFGRPEIKNVIFAQKGFDRINSEMELRDLYNLEDAFHMSGDYRPAYAARMNANLAAFDLLNGKADWELGADGRHPLTDLLLDDYMVVDVSKPVRERQLLRDRRDPRCSRPARTRRAGSVARGRRDGHHVHVHDLRRARGPRQRWRGPAVDAALDHVPLPRESESESAGGRGRAGPAGESRLMRIEATVCRFTGTSSALVRPPAPVAPAPHRR